MNAHFLHKNNQALTRQNAELLTEVQRRGEEIEELRVALARAQWVLSNVRLNWWQKWQLHRAAKRHEAERRAAEQGPGPTVLDGAAT